MIRETVDTAKFNPEARLPYELRLKDFELAMQDVYDFFFDVNGLLLKKGLRRLDDMLRRAAMSGMDYSGHITKCGDHALRTLLFECASVLLSRPQRQCALRSWALKVAKRTCRKKAVVALARKLAVVLHRMWANNTPFDWRLVEAAV